MGLPRHDGEVEGVVAKKDAVLIIGHTSVAAHAMLTRISHVDDATIVFHVCLRAGCCDKRNFSTSLARPLTLKQLRQLCK